MRSSFAHRAAQFFSAACLLWLTACVPATRDVRQVSPTITDDSHTLPGWLLPGNLAIIDLCNEQTFTEEELRNQLQEIKYAGFACVLFIGVQSVAQDHRNLPWSQRPVLTNTYHSAPLESTEKWQRLCTYAHDIGLKVLQDFQPTIHHLTHEQFQSRPGDFFSPDTSMSYTGPVHLRQNISAIRDSVENNLFTRARATGCDGFLLYSPEYFSKNLTARLQDEGKIVVNWERPIQGSDLVLIPSDVPLQSLSFVSAKSVPIWLCGLADEPESGTAYRMMLPGPAAAYWLSDGSADRVSFLASFNRLDREIQALNNGRMGGPLSRVSTDREPCVTAFRRIAGGSGAIFLHNRCDYTVDFKILSPMGGMYHNTRDFRLLSDFSPNRVVLQADRYTIFVRKPDTGAP